MATKIYTVQSGESLSAIAKKLYNEMERWKEIAYINSLSHPYIIYPGQILEVPDDKAPPMVIDAAGTSKPKTPTATPPAATSNSISPATVKMIAAGVVLYLLFK